MSLQVHHDVPRLCFLVRQALRPPRISTSDAFTTTSLSQHRGYGMVAAPKPAAELPDRINGGQVARVPMGGQAQQKEADREFFVDLLNSAATKRDAKAYLNRLRNPTKTKTLPIRPNMLEKGSYVNLGNLFPGSRAAEQSPVFSQSARVESEYTEREQLHVALIKITNIMMLPDNILHGIAETLAQLNRLSISPCVILDESQTTSRATVIEASNKLVSTIGEIVHASAREVNNVFNISSLGETIVSQRNSLLRPLRQGQIPVLPTIAYDEKEQKMTTISAIDAMLALTRDFVGASQLLKTEVSLDRLITVDSAGGILNEAATDGRHVFLNLEQEYATVRERLRRQKKDPIAQLQLLNLDMLQRALQILPPTSSGLMVTYEEAANVKVRSDDGSASNVGTRRQKNTLIHNILTDKPAYSSSLPLGRLVQKNDSHEPSPIVSRSSFVKRGMPLTILPNPFLKPWTATSPRLTLNDPQIDLDKLVFLIEDSFGRKLDLQHYLQRVNDRIAGVIIAGEYEGGAILTWETPPGNPGAQPVPYLDKFAVLRRSQGAGGVADIVFNAMVRSCFPNGVCWRSRGGNPVNKWYMERSRGTWKLSKAWTMFWTTPGIETDSKRFHDYAAVCRGVQPSWADRQKPAD